MDCEHKSGVYQLLYTGDLELSCMLCGSHLTTFKFVPKKLVHLIERTFYGKYFTLNEVPFYLILREDYLAAVFQKELFQIE